MQGKNKYNVGSCVLQGGRAKSPRKAKNPNKIGAFVMVPGEGVEPSHPLGRQILSLLRLPFRHPGRDGAGEGNRTLVASLEGWSSAIELRPQKRVCILMFLL